MAGTVVIIGFFLFIVLAGVGIVLMDKWLRDIDTAKYLTKSLKKQLKKGKITLQEFEQANNVKSP